MSDLTFGFVPQKTTDEAIAELELPNEKMRKWLHYFFKHFNKTRAAREAGYKNPENSGRDCYIVLKPFIEQEFRKQHISAGEVAVKFAQMATFDPTEYISPDGFLNFELLKKSGLGWMIEEISSRQVKDEDGKYHPVYTMKFHSQAKALEILGRYLGMEKQINIGNVIVSPKAFVEVSPNDWDNLENITENKKDATS